MSNQLGINKNLDIKYSFAWIKDAFYVFRHKPVHFAVLGLVYLLVTMLPILGSFVSPLILARFAKLSILIENNRDFDFTDVFENIFVNKNLVKLAFLNFCVTGLILLMQIFYENQSGHPVISKSTDLLVLIVIFLPTIMLQISMWISPIVCLINPDISAVDSMILSIKAGLYNVSTLIFYTLFLVVFTIVACLPLLLGLLIWVPVMNISSYFIYKNIFIRNV